MIVSVEEILEDGSSFSFTIIVGKASNDAQITAAELMTYTKKGSQTPVMVFPKAPKMSNEEKFLMRGSFKEIFVNTENEDVFEMPVTQLFKMRSEVWLKAETLVQYVKQNNISIKNEYSHN